LQKQSSAKFNAALILIAALSINAIARPDFSRSKAAPRAFVIQQACPSTGQHRLPCPGWQIDHIVPLKCGGMDNPINLQWLTVEDHKEKTKREVMECRK
jgi:5-methylcytosine-specific restriction endonuclease McrA